MITIVDVDKLIREEKWNGPVTSPQIFLGTSYNFHPQGLMSEDIFGLDGSVPRSNSYSWLELNCKIINPVLYELISKGIERKIPLAIDGQHEYNIDSDGYLEEVGDEEEGLINGLQSIVDNIGKIKFRNPTGTRGRVIDVMYENIRKGTFFIDKLIVISPVYRNVEVRDTDRKEIITDEMTSLYKRIIEVSTQVKSASGSVYDIICKQLQNLVMDMFALVKKRVAKKHGVIRRMILGKRVDFSARAVITPNPDLDPGYVGIPLRIICDIFVPHLIYGFAHSNYSNNIPDEFHTAAKEYLGKESMLDV
jgi:hypothetical protein